MTSRRKYDGRKLEVLCRRRFAHSCPFSSWRFRRYLRSKAAEELWRLEFPYVPRKSGPVSRLSLPCQSKHEARANLATTHQLARGWRTQSGVAPGRTAALPKCLAGQLAASICPKPEGRLWQCQKIAAREPYYLEPTITCCDNQHGNQKSIFISLHP
jgi:hypothetical protein